MKRIFLYATAVLLIIMSACKDKPGEEPETPLDKVNALIAGGGTLQTAEAKSEVKTLSVDTAAAVRHNDPDLGNYSAYPVKSVKHYSMVDNPMEFVTLDPWDVLWPGALIQGGSLRNGVPSSIPVYGKRLPGRVYLSLVSGNEDMDRWYRDTPMRGSDVTQAMNSLMKEYADGITPARTAFEIETVTCMEELSLKLGLNMKLFGGKLNSSFGSNWSSEKSYAAVKLNQIFYTMAYDGPDGGFAGAFMDDITVDDLKNYTGPGNPICYVASVSYGRSFILLYESEKSRRELEVALTAAYKGVDAKATTEQKNIVNSSKCKLVQIGGNPVAGLEAAFGDFDKIRKFVSDGAAVSSKNPGSPISYKIVHLHDNSPARLSNTLEYNVTTTEYLPVEPENNVVISVFNAVMQSPETDRDLSNHSKMKIKSLTVSCGPADNVEKHILPPTEFHTDELGTKNGTDVPIYNAYVLNRVLKNEWIRIKCIVYVRNQTYGGPTEVGEQDITLIQDFEFSTDLGKWQPVDRVSHHPFEKLQIVNRDIGGSARTNFELNYRFSCDGRTYSYAEDGSAQK